MRWFKYISITVFCVCLAAFMCHYLGLFEEKDNQGPVITFDSEMIEVSVSSSDEEFLTGVTANDNVDGDVSESLIVSGLSLINEEEHTRNITYAAFDSSNNVSTKTRTIKYTDYKKPEFSLTKELVIYEGDKKSVLNYIRAYDVIDGDISQNIKLVSGSDTYTAVGYYPVVVGVSNSCGDYSEIELSVNVKENNAAVISKTPEIALTDYLVYLKAGDSFEPMVYIKSVQSKVDGEVIDNSAVGVSSNADTAVPGRYIVTYYVGNSLGLMGESNLTVIVE